MKPAGPISGPPRAAAGPAAYAAAMPRAAMTLCLLRAGSDELTPPMMRALLVIHGGPDWDHSYLREPLDRLAGRHRLILPDLRGCGRSTRGPGDGQYTPDAATGDLAVLLAALGVTGADVLGFSYGGLLAQRLALAAPHRVRRLITASSSVLPVPPGAFEGWAERDRRTAAAKRVWSDLALSGPDLTRAAAIAQAPADLWRWDAMAGYPARLQRIRFSAEWLRPVHGRRSNVRYTSYAYIVCYMSNTRSTDGEDGERAHRAADQVSLRGW
jgi:pimeloyl-ACP methyl ester carboxylesterase